MSEFLKRSIEKLILCNEEQLKQNLAEPIDHKVVLETKTENGNLYSMKQSKNILQLIVNKQIEDNDDIEDDSDDNDNKAP